MKKFLTTILALLSACCLFSACNMATETPKTEKPINPTPPASSVQEGDPEFPSNGFDTDNESAYPDAWN